MLPLRRPRYKRCSRTFNVKITPHMAEAIESFEDTPLSEYLQDQLAVAEGEDVEAEVHLFEVLPGSTAADIARSESETIGLGASDEATLAQLQPLTHEAAGVLLGTPGLGRRLPAGVNIRNVAAGPASVSPGHSDRRPLTVARAQGPQPRAPPGTRVRHARSHEGSGARVRVPQRSEGAAARRSASPAVARGSLTVGFQKLLARRLPPILHGKRRGGCRSCIPRCRPAPHRRRIWRSCRRSFRRRSSQSSGMAGAGVYRVRQDAVAEVPRRRRRSR